MKTRSAKAKGRRCAQAVKDLLLKYNEDLTQNDIFVTPSGVVGEDLYLSEIAQGVYPFAIECKNQERLNIWEALEQADSHVKNTKKTPILCFQKNRSELYIALRLEDFLRLYKSRKGGI